MTSTQSLAQLSLDDVLKIGVEAHNSQNASTLRDVADVLMLNHAHIDRAARFAAFAYVGLQDWAATDKACAAVIKVRPDDVAIIQVRAGALYELGDYAGSRDCYATLLAQGTPTADQWTMYARVCLSAFDYDGAQTAIDNALAIGPTSSAMMYVLSRLKLFQGDMQAAETAAAQAIALGPVFTRSFVQYTALKGGNVGDVIANKINYLAQMPDNAPADRAALRYALGEIAEARELYAEAMKQYTAGAELSEGILAKEGRSYDAAQSEQLRAREMGLQAAFHPVSNAQAARPMPIFVIGMPRSGTTLIESILAAHPDVVGAGELDTLPRIQLKALEYIAANQITSLADIDPTQLLAWRNNYLSELSEKGSARFIVDKQPLNFRSVGLIKCLFPEASIIHIRRNPLDTGVSIFRNDFSKAWPYSTSLAKIGHFYSEYARFMEQWSQQGLTPSESIQYEDLISNFEPNVRSLLAGCGLVWNDACLRFNEHKRPVATFSSISVRQPLRTSTLDAAGKFGDLLAPLSDALTQNGVDLVTGALRQAG